MGSSFLLSTAKYRQLDWKDSITVGGFFHHVSHAVRRSVLLDMLDGIPGITMTWTATHKGRGCSLESNGEYQALIAASTKEKDCANLDQHQMIRVDVQGSTEAPLKMPVEGVSALRVVPIRR